MIEVVGTVTDPEEFAMEFVHALEGSVVLTDQ